MNPKIHRSESRCLLPALLLAVWYLLSVTGLDVHSDHEHGRTYVVCGLTGCDCEHIHPHTHCHDTDPERECLEGEECCSDDFEAVLSLSDGSDRMCADFPAPVSQLTAIQAASAVTVPALVSPILKTGPPPPLPRGGRLSLFCTLRA